MAKPASLPTWDSGLVHVTATPAGWQNSGFATGDTFASDVENYWRNLVYQWISWQSSNASITYPFAVGAHSGTSSDTASAFTDVVTTTDGTAAPTTKVYSLGVPVGYQFSAIHVRINQTDDAWRPSQAYAVGQRVLSDTATHIYTCTVAGTSAGSGGPTGTGTGIVDGGVTWDYVGLPGAAGSGTVKIAFAKLSDATLTTIATSSFNAGHGVAETLTLSGLTEVAAADTTYFAVVSIVSSTVDIYAGGADVTIP